MGGICKKQTATKKINPNTKTPPQTTVLKDPLAPAAGFFHLIYENRKIYFKENEKKIQSQTSKRKEGETKEQNQSPMSKNKASESLEKKQNQINKEGKPISIF